MFGNGIAIMDLSVKRHQNLKRHFVFLYLRKVFERQ